MKVWIARRRKAGMVMPAKFTLGFGDADAPVELIVKNVTDQGLRRPGKVARLYSPGDPMVLAELLHPKLIWMREQAFVISGTEKVLNGDRQNVGFSQSWLCQLAPPLSRYSLRVLETIKNGVQVPGPQLRDTVYRGWPGSVSLSFEMVPQLRRHAKVARFNSGTRLGQLLLLDVELEWMTEDRYELSGTTLVSERERLLETHYAGGWLCRFWPPELEEPADGKASSHFEDWKG